MENIARATDILLETTLDADPITGALRLDYAIPKAKGAVRTSLGHAGKLFSTKRRLSNGNQLTIFSVYKRDAAPYALIKAIKAETSKLASWITAAVDFVARQPNFSEFSLITPVSSSQPLTDYFARELGRRLNIPVEKYITKLSGLKMAHTPISKRKYAVQGLFSVSATGAKVLVVDDVTTTNMTLVSVAEKFYRAGADTVSAIALIS